MTPAATLSGKHLFVDISSHGFGHLSQVAPVLNVLAQRLPGLRITVRSGLPVEKLRARLLPAFTHLATSSDFGYVMHDAVSIDLEASARAYRTQHEHWARKVADEAALIHSLQPDLVFTDVAYLPLAGAAVLCIPTVSLCSLNWADMFLHYFGAESGSLPIYRQMLNAYRSVACFLRATPGMPMTALTRVRPIGPIAALGQDCRARLRERWLSPDDEILVLVAFGGIDKRLPLEHWPRIDGVRWLVPGAWQLKFSNTCAIESLDLGFTDLLRSADVVLTKPGYGTFAEAACNGTRVLYVRRADWPEQDCLIDWLTLHGSCREIDEADLMAGRLQESLSTLMKQPRPTPPDPVGAAGAAEVLYSLLDARCA